MKRSVKVNELAVGNAVWFNRSVIVKVIEVQSNRVVVKKLEAPLTSTAQFCMSFYTSINEDLLARVNVASMSDCKQYMEDKSQILGSAMNKFFEGFPQQQ